jgi:hypothetical protein
MSTEMPKGKDPKEEATNATNRQTPRSRRKVDPGRTATLQPASPRASSREKKGMQKSGMALPFKHKKNERRSNITASSRKSTCSAHRRRVLSPRWQMRRRAPAGKPPRGRGGPYLLFKYYTPDPVGRGVERTSKRKSPADRVLRGRRGRTPKNDGPVSPSPSSRRPMDVKEKDRNPPRRPTPRDPKRGRTGLLGPKSSADPQPSRWPQPHRQCTLLGTVLTRHTSLTPLKIPQNQGHPPSFLQRSNEGCAAHHG